MSLLEIIDLLCDITDKETALLRELVTELEHDRQVSEEVKSYYRCRFDEINRDLDSAEHGQRKIV